MNRSSLRLLLTLLALLAPLLFPAALAAEDPSSASPTEAPQKPTMKLEEQSSVTRHQIIIDGQQVAYKATAGTLILSEEDGTQKASVFYIAYTRDGVEDPAGRPLTFSFNGGPGSSSVWLHMGVLGPRRVLMDDEGFALPPPYRLVDNEHSLLDVTDLVFIDPVSTGYSRPAPGQEKEQFHGVEEDVAAVGDFIRLYTSRFERWASPIFLAGESYGTTRAAGLSGYLQQRHGLYLNGLLLISSVLNFQTVDFEIGNDLPYILILPTFTATAWYHDQLAPELQEDLRKTLDGAEAFALGDYASALLQGDDLPEERRRQVVAELARYTGLSPEYLELSNLRPEIFRFTKELRRDERLTVGRLDSRFTGRDRDAAGESFEYDPSYAAILGPFTATLNDYLRRELGFESELPYEILTDKVRPWSFDEWQNRYVNVAETLRQAMSQNPHLKVWVANGYYDLATPYFATEYTFSHLGLEPELRGNVSMDYYEAGHMMYIHRPSLEKFKRDAARFVTEAVPE